MPYHPILTAPTLSAFSQDPTQRALLLWPVKQLDFSRRYVVAMRGLVDGDRNSIAPSDAFRAFRDGIPTDDPDIETRRDVYAVHVLNIGHGRAPRMKHGRRSRADEHGQWGSARFPTLTAPVHTNTPP